MVDKQYKIKIYSSNETVWNVLWDDKTFRDWASNIDEGTYLLGELKEGEEVQFLSSVSGYGVTSLVEKLVPKKFVSFKHLRDTKDNGSQDRMLEWTGKFESYNLDTHENFTVLTIKIQVPFNLQESFDTSIPIALERIKNLAEKRDGAQNTGR